MPLISFMTDSVWLNLTKTNLGTPVAAINVVHSRQEAAAIKAGDTGTLFPVIFLAKMCTCNAHCL